ncbi:MAG TPA: GNAT family N-acetyltransferase [Myxococcales bacterium]|jgi:predicted GNAT family N-acyltransferase|nr:GNAT family N-acetyltransferase [Myxococcales bacterium]
MIEVRIAQSPKDVQTCLRLRWTVFVEEQGVRPSDELDAHDRNDAIHALASLDGVPCGAGRFIFEEPGLAKIQRMAVVDDVRGRGVGKALLQFLEAEASRRGASRLTLWAQVRARPFYEKAGYAPVGAEFDDGTGIPHQRMDKRI